MEVFIKAQKIGLTKIPRLLSDVFLGTGRRLLACTLIPSAIMLALSTAFLLFWSFPFVHASPWPLLALSAFGVMASVLAYNTLFPRIRPTQPLYPGKVSSPLGIVLSISKPEERLVLEVLRDQGGSCPQSLITRRTDLSKVRVHRIVHRLAERGIVEVSRLGKSNMIRLAGWLQESDAKAEGSTP